MQEFIKADIFFFITSIAVVLVTVGVIIALYYIVRILRNVKDVTERVDEGSKILAEDFSELRSDLKAKGFIGVHLFNFLRKQSRWFAPKRSQKTPQAK